MVSFVTSGSGHSKERHCGSHPDDKSYAPQNVQQTFKGKLNVTLEDTLKLLIINVFKK